MVRLFVGGHAATVAGIPMDLTGDREFSAAHRPERVRYPDGATIVGLLDSGAFTDPPEKRLAPEAALMRQLRFEEAAKDKWSLPDWHASYLVSYDLLIDETWAGNTRTKRRWSVADAEWAVAETVHAARYLALQRQHLRPRTLVLSCQGVQPDQYERCVRQVLEVASPRDWLGLGGWCILGRFRSWLPAFWETCERCLPLVVNAGLSHVHVFGVLWEPALARLLWLCDQHGLSLSTDSAAPVLAATWKGPGRAKKAGVRAPGTWRDNVAWWQWHLANLRGSTHYRPLPQQMTLEGII